ncbi:P-loop containing nucleoside triphosphate hydrolase protein [Thozetella sp. PMI_491]|nr:P-loop containing nucleoside triphosphate hydrolase protein [Thozetella sp. PMI_491]
MPQAEQDQEDPPMADQQPAVAQKEPEGHHHVTFQDDASDPGDASDASDGSSAASSSGESFEDEESSDVDVLVRKEYLHHLSFETVRVSSKAAPPEKPKKTIRHVMEYVEVVLTNQINSRGSSVSKHAITVVGKGRSYIKILSPAVMEALRAVVDFFPSEDLSGDTITLHEPYQLIVHFDEELTRFRERLESDTSDVPELCKLPRAAKEVEIVQTFVREKMRAKISAERERNARGFATYDMLWLLYKPGIDVYFDKTNCGEHEPFVVHNLTFNVENGAIPSYDITYWNMNANSTYVGPSTIYKTIEPFAGEKAITDLRAYPCEYLKHAQGYEEGSMSQIKQHFIERGRKWFNMRRKESYYSFDGVTTTFPRRRHESLVMVDPIQYMLYMNSERDDLMSSIERSSATIHYCPCERCDRLIYQHTAEPRFINYTKINPMTTAQLTEHQYFLCDRKVEAFVFKLRDWRDLDIMGFEQPKFDKSLFDRLVLGQETRDTIKKLTQMYIRGISKPSSQEEQAVTMITSVHKEKKKEKADLNWSADLIEGKGEGLNILLHGKPGVGKTYTAECIAEYTERPLLSLTCSDIGVDPLVVERNLVKWFKLAENWGAIILLDEADIYLEQRQIQDLERNHLVAGFLRALEYYKGILFLTTNRVGTFDEAFISRLHIQLYYPEFTDTQREAVWRTFFRKLEDDREMTMRIPQSTKDYVQSQELQGLNWNGREIRNAFQVAVALAEAEGDKDKQGRVLVKSDHIRATVKMSREFKDYLLKLHGSDLSKRAALRGYRLDAYRSEESKESY